MNEEPMKGGRTPALETSLRTDYGHFNGSDGTCLHATVYGLTCAQYEEMRDRAGDCCELCRTPGPETPRGSLVIDHFDGMGVNFVRGLLCDRCNALMSRYDGTAPWGPSTEHRKDEAHAYHLAAYGAPSAEDFARANKVLTDRQRHQVDISKPYVPTQGMDDYDIQAMAHDIRTSLTPREVERLASILIVPWP
ncbi:endonuclease VII domain-containing protein [Streptomyces sp. NBC_00669]|uniref:endonuclease domain-containing protein n=1 Tax=Streptomyces sp. NBC_00669 TaxID=2976011 RepID=UPI002E2ECA3B|nr:endonuclease domain-containing protein [Streptomyces sp. NBC_00669]